MRYQNTDEISAVTREFENGTIARPDWRHAEHLTVAFYYVSRNDLGTALKKMRGGIFNLLRAFQIDLTKETPYHETLTVFWLKTVDNFAKSNDGKQLIEIVNELIEQFDKDYPLEFYSREVLFSDEARTKYVAPDLPKSSV